MKILRGVGYPSGDGRDGGIEVRRFFELEDFGPGEAAERFRWMGAGAKI